MVNTLARNLTKDNPVNRLESCPQLLHFAGRTRTSHRWRMDLPDSTIDGNMFAFDKLSRTSG
jgi:hypothetical protein